MKTKILALIIAALAVAGCDSAQRTADTLQKEIASYPSDPSAEAADKIEQSFDRLDQEIQQLRSSGKSREAESLEQQRQNLQAQYLAARMTEGLQKNETSSRRLRLGPASSRRHLRRSSQSHTEPHAGRLTVCARNLLMAL